MTVIHTFADLINLWPKTSTHSLSGDLGLKEITVRQWKARGIPSKYWLEIVAAADARGISGITLDALAKIDTKQAGRAVPAIFDGEAA